MLGMIASETPYGARDRTPAQAAGSAFFATLGLAALLAGCDPCSGLDAERAPPGIVQPELRVAVTLEAVSAMVSAELTKTRTRGTRRVERLPDRRSSLVATGRSASVTVLANPSDDCPTCAVLRTARPVDLALGPDGGEASPLGRVHVLVQVPVTLAVRKGTAASSFEVVAINDAAHEPEMEDPAKLPPGLPPDLAPAAIRLARQVARLDSLGLALRSPLLRIQAWPVAGPGLRLSRLDLSLRGRLLRIDGFPDTPLSGPGLADAKVEPAVGQDVTWAISGALLAALGADAAPTLQPLSLLDATHTVTIRSLTAHDKGLAASIRTRRTEGCGWVDLSAAPLRPTTSQGRPSLQAPLEVELVEAGGADSGAELDEGFGQAALERTTRLLGERLAHPLVQGPNGRALRTLITRRSREVPAVLVDGAFNRPRRTSRPPNRPPPALPGSRPVRPSPAPETPAPPTPGAAPGASPGLAPEAEQAR